MAGTVYVGLDVCAHNSAMLSTATAPRNRTPLSVLSFPARRRPQLSASRFHDPEPALERRKPG